MKPNEVVNKIFDLCQNSSLSFLDKTKQIKLELNRCSKEEILEHLFHAGVIPECFGHDSTEEKIYAKYCNILVAKAFEELGLKAVVIEARAGAPDVIIRYSDYEVAGDAKAFRLSRTAKNQKDFKIEALNQWKGKADYAFIIAPIYQYLKSRSQIYDQAIRYNVTLLSFTHLAFMMRSKKFNIESLKELWEAGKKMNRTQKASIYWSEIEKIMLRITEEKSANWKKTVSNRYDRLKKQAEEQILHWEKEKKKVSDLNHDVAVTELIKALKIDAKISEIKKIANL